VRLTEAGEWKISRKYNPPSKLIRMVKPNPAKNRSPIKFIGDLIVTIIHYLE
jgi:hypothetical protein